MYSLGNVFTDFIVASVNFVLAFWILKSTGIKQRKTFTVWFALFFISMSFSGIAKALGVLYPPELSLKNDVIEKVCYALLGIGGLASSNIGARLACKKSTRRTIYRIAYSLFGILTCYIILIDNSFFAVLIHNSIGLLFLLMTLIIQFYKKWDKEIAFGVLGILMTFLSLIVRQLAVGVDDAIIGLELFFNGLSLVSSLMVFSAAKLLVSQKYSYLAMRYV
jgi:hypothetical protein